MPTVSERKQAYDLWREHCHHVQSITDVSALRTETPAERQRRIARLRQNYAAFCEYYFPHFLGLRDVINNQLLPRMQRHGFPLQGLRFEWDESVDYTPEQQVAYETMVADRYEVDPQYFAEKYSIPVGERRNYATPIMDGPDDDDDEPTDDKKGNNKNKNKNRKQQNKKLDGSFFD